jgi:hypothetical protein
MVVEDILAKSNHQFRHGPRMEENEDTILNFQRDV